MRSVLLLVVAATGCSLGDGSFRWYCDELSSQPNTWALEASGDCASLTGSFAVRFDVTTPQPAGDGSTCTLSRWTYGSEPMSDFIGTSEWCAASVTCALADGSSASGNLQVFRWSDVSQREAGGDVDRGGANACSTVLSGRPR